MTFLSCLPRVRTCGTLWTGAVINRLCMHSPTTPFQKHHLMLDTTSRIPTYLPDLELILLAPPILLAIKVAKETPSSIPLALSISLEGQASQRPKSPLLPTAAARSPSIRSRPRQGRR